MTYAKTVDTEGIAKMFGLTREHVTDRLTEPWCAGGGSNCLA